MSSKANEAASAELRDLVEGHLGRSKPDDIAIGIVCTGLARVGEGFAKAQARDVDWGAALGLLREGADVMRQGLPTLKRSKLEIGGLVALVERQLKFAELLQNEILRLQAGETTLV